MLHNIQHWQDKLKTSFDNIGESDKKKEKKKDKALKKAKKEKKEKNREKERNKDKSEHGGKSEKSEKSEKKEKEKKSKKKERREDKPPPQVPELFGMSDQTTIKHSIVKPVVKSATPKGQLISKGIFGVLKSTKKPTKYL